MKFCLECNNTGLCVWCRGAGKEGLASVCRSCHGIGLCFSCCGATFEFSQIDQRIGHENHESGARKPVISARLLDGFEDINFIRNYRAEILQSSLESLFIKPPLSD